MLKKFLGCVREYKLPSILTIIFMMLEALIEAIIPFITSQLVNEVRAGAEIAQILKLGGLLVIMAIISLACGGTAAFTGAKASTGFAKNLRHDLFYKVQSFSFGNIDKFSSSSLVISISIFKRLQLL